MTEKERMPVGHKCGCCGNWIKEPNKEFLKAFENTNSKEGIDYRIELDWCERCHWWASVGSNWE